MKSRYQRDPSEYPYWWMFTDDTIGMSDDDLAALHFLTEEAAQETWEKRIAPLIAELQYTEGPRFNWEDYWDDDPCSELPNQVLATSAAPLESKAVFAWSPGMAVETTWDVFRRNWKCFLFLDEGPVLLVGQRAR